MTLCEAHEAGKILAEPFCDNRVFPPMRVITVNLAPHQIKPEEDTGSREPDRGFPESRS